MALLSVRTAVCLSSPSDGGRRKGYKGEVGTRHRPKTLAIGGSAFCKINTGDPSPTCRENIRYGNYLSHMPSL